MKKQTNLKTTQKISLKNNDIIERVYTLGDSETISKIIVALIINLAYHKIRNKYINSFQKPFINKFTMKLIKELTNFELNIELQPDLFENNNILIYEIEKPRIDSWASDKCSVENKFLEQLKPIAESAEEENNPSPNFKRRNGRLTTGNCKIGTERNTIKISELAKLREDKKISFIPKYEEIKEKKVKKVKIVENNKNVEFEDLPQLELNPMKSECKEEIDEFYDKDREKADQLYFREKEAERKRRTRLEAELLEDDEKKKKQSQEEPLAMIITDSSGNLLKPFIINADKLRGFAESKFIIRNEEELKEYKEKLRLKEKRLKEGKNADLTNNLEKVKIEKIPKIERMFLKNEVIQEFVPELYFQPEPVKSHVLSEGVDMTYYKQKKKGGNFPKNPNKMDKSEFNFILSQIKPKYNKKQENQSIAKISEIPEENYNTINNTNKNSKVFMILTTEEDTFTQEKTKGNKEEKFSSIFQKDLINERLKNRNPPWKIEKKESNTNFVKTDSNIRFDTLQHLDDDRLYDKLLYQYDGKSSTNRLRKTILPKTHGNLTVELGLLSKYPRERIAREILRTTGKISVAKSNNIDKKGLSDFKKSKFNEAFNNK